MGEAAVLAACGQARQRRAAGRRRCCSLRPWERRRRRRPRRRRAPRLRRRGRSTATRSKSRIGGERRGRPLHRRRHAGDGQAGHAGAVLRAAAPRPSTTAWSRAGGCGSSSASSGATSTAGCSPTSTSGDRFVNASLVRRGLARTLTIPPNDRFAPLFRRLELRAARAGRGPLGRLLSS